VLQWIQYQLDCSATIDDVIDSDAHIRITNYTAPLHYLIADASGRAATIEFLNGKLKVHTGDNLPYPVLTNSIYSQSVKHIMNKNFAGYDRNSLNRFSTACNMVKKFQQGEAQQPPVDYAFSILNNVAQENTKWSIVYDISNKQVHFKTSSHQQLKTFYFADFNFSCTGVSLAFDMNNNIAGKTNNLFLPLTIDRNKMLIEKSAEESRSHVKIEKASIDEAVALYKNEKCNIINK
jgi:choloylglycine hydrolase